MTAYPTTCLVDHENGCRTVITIEEPSDYDTEMGAIARLRITVDNVKTIKVTQVRLSPEALEALERRCRELRGVPEGPPESPGSTLAPSSPWRPIEDYLSLTPGEYMVRMKRGELAEHITIARWSGAEWQVRIVDAERYYYRAEHITHVHSMGLIRGPGETT